DSRSVIAMGLCYSVRGLLSLRGGYRFGADLGSLSAGAGFEASYFSLDYAFLGQSHRITATLRRSPTRPKPVAESPQASKPGAAPSPAAQVQKVSPSPIGGPSLAADGLLV